MTLTLKFRGKIWNSGMGGLIDMVRKGCKPSIFHIDLYVTMVVWVDVPDNDWGDIRRWRAGDISSVFGSRWELPGWNWLCQSSVFKLTLSLPIMGIGRCVSSPDGGELTTDPALANITSLWPSDAIWRHRSESTLGQVMAYCLTTPSHYLNQCWLIIT